MALLVKNPSANVGDIREVGSIPESGRSPGGGHGNPLQYSCLENPMDREAWQDTVHGVAESQTRLKRLTFSLFSFVMDYNFPILKQWKLRLLLLGRSKRRTFPHTFHQVQPETLDVTCETNRRL